MKLFFVSPIIATSKKVLLLCLSLICLIADIAYAQRPVGSASNSGCFRQSIQPISLIPTFRTDMNIDCILGYIYLDSLCRSSLTWEQIDSLSNQLKNADTLRTFMRFEYKMREYDADLYNEYQAAAGKIVNGHKSPGAISDIINKKMKLILGDNNKLAYLTHADLILHVRVKSIYADVDTMASIPIEPLPLLCVQAMIIDTIKGLHIRNGGYEDCGKCISFNFSPYWKKANFNHVVDKDLDSNGMPQPCDICYGNNSLQVSKDYIVFLRDKFLDYNGVNSFYTYWPFGGYSSEGGIFQIDESNNVLIPSDYFGYGVSVPLSNFESLLRNDINTIAAH